MAIVKPSLTGARQAGGPPPVVVAGYAALFGVPDLGGDTIAYGAFARSLARRGAGGVRMLFNHEVGQPIGVWDDLREDARGLFVRGRLTPGVARAAELSALLDDGALDGLSIGYRAVKFAALRPGRRLTEIDLWEVSIVTFPMQPLARLARRAARPGQR